MTRSLYVVLRFRVKCVDIITCLFIKELYGTARHSLVKFKLRFFVSWAPMRGFDEKGLQGLGTLGFRDFRFCGMWLRD